MREQPVPQSPPVDTTHKNVSYLHATTAVRRKELIVMLKNEGLAWHGVKVWE